jgi:hypothetical protein
VKTSPACDSCHDPLFRQTTNPNHVTSKFPITCEVCHNTTTWTNATFNHASVFPLVGAHASLPCAQCHLNNDYSVILPTTCYGCHQKDFTTANNPPHSTFPQDCTTCHGPAPMTWTSGVKFNHLQYGNWPLTGAHAPLACASCHTGPSAWVKTSPACDSCHDPLYRQTTNPNHVTSNFPTTCEICHNTTSWTNATFNHAQFFPLVGAHATLQCAQCHLNNNYSTILPTTCDGCHDALYRTTNNPSHVAANFPTDCTVCHGTAPMAWIPVTTFNHQLYANWALTGAHAAVTCVQCHGGDNYVKVPPITCDGCHDALYRQTTNPNHVTSNFPTTCEVCHNTSSWTNATFNHAQFFPLVGAHTTLQCAQCHLNNNYSTILPTTCDGCHDGLYRGTNNPSHVAAKFPIDCTICHGTAPMDWTSGINFNHALYTPWPLTGAHATVQCALCHTGNNWNNLPTACINCHQDKFNSANNPSHTGFPTDCTICHSTANWTSSTFNHASVFPLTGYHATMACAGCHVNNNYTTLKTTCDGCHDALYQTTNNPAHAAAGFPTTCDTCHTTTSWAGASFNHNNTPFPLTGAHTSVACNLCHVNNVFAGTPTDCYSCHKADYNGTTNPNHATAGWPTASCATCHTTTAWLPGTLPSSYHTFFPLNHGNANGVCTTCHTNSSDYSVFTCTGCHGGNNAANFHHPNVNGYVYNSVNCYACHKNGGGG